MSSLLLATIFSLSFSFSLRFCKKWAIPGLFLFISVFFKQTTIFTTNQCEKCPSSAGIRTHYLQNVSPSHNHQTRAPAQLDFFASNSISHLRTTQVVIAMSALPLAADNNSSSNSYSLWPSAADHNNATNKLGFLDQTQSAFNRHGTANEMPLKGFVFIFIFVFHSLPSLCRLAFSF